MSHRPSANHRALAEAQRRLDRMLTLLPEGLAVEAELTRYRTDVAQLTDLVQAEETEAARPVAERRNWLGIAAGVTAFGAGRARQHPSSEQIAVAQRHLWARRFRGVGEATTHCWACQERAELERAHIHPVRWGGSDEPWNFLLLCAFCHIEQEDDSSRAAQLKWLRSHKRRAEHWVCKLKEIANG